MAKRPPQTKKIETDVKELVAAVFAEDMEQAETYKALLKSDNISATIKQQSEEPDDPTSSPVFAVMVSEEFIDEAHVVIESQNAYDDFYDFASEDGDDEDFDDDLFEDEL